MIIRSKNLIAIDYDMVKGLNCKALSLYVHMVGLDINELAYSDVVAKFPDVSAADFVIAEHDIKNMTNMECFR